MSALSEGINAPRFCPAHGPLPLHIRATFGMELGGSLPIFNHWNASCYRQVLKTDTFSRRVVVGKPGGKDFGQMELKIVVLLALIAAIAAASYVGGRSQERANQRAN
jgi:hypothetical protein